MTQIVLEQLNAVNRFALAYGRGWKEQLQKVWIEELLPVRVERADWPLLRQVRNSAGPEILMKYKANPVPWTAVGRIVKDHQERFNLKRGWFVNAWRLVSHTGDDMVQPWFNSKADLREYAKTANIYVIEQ